jgi:hypothetical protein
LGVRDPAQQRSLQQYKDFERAAASRSIHMAGRSITRGGNRDPICDADLHDITALDPIFRSPN